VTRSVRLAYFSTASSSPASLALSSSSVASSLARQRRVSTQNCKLAEQECAKSCSAEPARGVDAPPLFPLVQLLRLQRGRLAVKHVHRPHACLQHARCACEHALEVGRDVACLVGELLLALAAHDCHELVDVHACVNGYLAAKVVLKLVLFAAAGGVVRQQLREALDAHLARSLRCRLAAPAQAVLGTVTGLDGG
jgi:hypothetical protein